MPELAAVTKKQTLIDKLHSLSTSIPNRKPLPILGADLTSEEKDSLPFWSEFVQAMSEGLSLPTKTASAVSGLTSSNGSVSVTGANSWFSTRTTSLLSESWLRTSLPLFTSLVADSTALESTNNNSKKTRKSKKSSRHKSQKEKPNVSRKIRLYPDSQQRQHWWTWISACRFVYNKAIAELKDKGVGYFQALFTEKRKAYKQKTGKSGSTSSQYFRDYIMGSQDLPDWVKDAPCHIKQNAIEDAWDAYNQGLANAGCAKFRSCKAPSQAIKFNSGNFKKGQWYPSLAPGSFASAEPLPEFCLYGTILVKQRNRWYAIIPYSSVLEPTESTGVIALDPGVRTFLTGYDGDQVIEIATGCIGRIYRLCQHLDNLLSRASKSPRKKRRRLHQAANRMRFKIPNLINEVHHQVAAYLTDNYRVIFLPKFQSSQMVSLATRKIGRKSVRAMMNWAHFRFKQHLKQLATRKGVVVVDVAEGYTSKTCSKCGHVHAKLHGSKAFDCPNCGHESDRDANGARNILLRALQDTAFTVSDDGIAVAVAC